MTKPMVATAKCHRKDRAFVVGMKCHMRPRITNINILMMLMFLSKTLLRCRNAAIPPAFLCSHLDSQRNTVLGGAREMRALMEA